MASWGRTPWSHNFVVILGIMHDHGILPDDTMQYNRGILPHYIMQKGSDREIFYKFGSFCTEVLGHAILVIYYIIKTQDKVRWRLNITKPTDLIS
jgi:hypothetical protein